MLATGHGTPPITAATIKQIRVLAELGMGIWHSGAIPDALLLARMLELVDRLSPTPLGPATVAAVAEYAIEDHTCDRTH